MGFFDRDADDSEEGRRDRQALAAGGLPAHATERLDGLLGPDSLFTSTLSVGEFALLTDRACTPLGQVLGASVYQVGWQYLPPSAGWGGEVFWELGQVTGAWDHARRLAFKRLTEEATVLGADAVVGVRLRRGEHDWARSSVDYVVSGTGIREPGGERPAAPVLTDLSGQEYWKLRQAGWAPSALVAATGVFFVSQSTATRWRRRLSATRNQELDEYSRGLTEARLSVVRSLRGQAQSARANGIVGVRLVHSVTRATVKVDVQRQRSGVSVTTIGMGGDAMAGRQDERVGVSITIHGVGTAIRRDPDGAPRRPPAVLRIGVSA